MRAILMAVATMAYAACSGGVTGDDVAADADATLAVDAAIDAGCGTPERNAECVHACDPFTPSHRCVPSVTDACVAECVACAAAGNWCP